MPLYLFWLFFVFSGTFDAVFLSYAVYLIRLRPYVTFYQFVFQSSWHYYIQFFWAQSLNPTSTCHSGSYTKILHDVLGFYFSGIIANPNCSTLSLGDPVQVILTDSRGKASSKPGKYISPIMYYNYLSNYSFYRVFLANTLSARRGGAFSITITKRKNNK